jgi:hypothetical protein
MALTERIDSMISHIDLVAGYFIAKYHDHQMNDQMNDHVRAKRYHSSSKHSKMY